MRYLLSAVVALVLASTGYCQNPLPEQLNLVVVFDGSGSMGDRFSKSADRGTKMQAAKKALVQILNQLPANTNLGIVVFSSSDNGWLVKLGPIDKTNLTQKINNVREGGGTPLGRYMKDGANALLELRAKQKSGVYKLLVVTDGESSDDIETPLTGKYGILSKSLRVEAIGVDMSNKHSLATKVPYRSAENAEQLTSAVKAILAESTGKNDHSEDYDLIAPLPPEVAMAALVALSEIDNEPVGSPPKIRGSVNISFGDGSGGGSSIALIVVSIIIGAVVVIAVIAVIVCNKR
jgi:hypothetical protein